MAEVVGLVASVVGILEFIRKIAQRLPIVTSALKGEWKAQLTQLSKDVNVLIERLELVKKEGKRFRNESGLNAIKSDLQAVCDALQSLERASASASLKFSAARSKSGIPSKLDEAMRRFASAKERVLDEATFCVLGAVLDSKPGMSKIPPDLPRHLVGGKSLEEVLRLLRKDRRVVITGAGGLGKTTLLKWTLDELRKTAAAAAEEDVWKEAYVHIGKAPHTPDLVTGLQFSILQQLVDSWNDKLQSPDHGRGAIQSVLSTLRIRNRKIRLAVDDVWDAAILRALLPSENLASLLEEGYLVVTTRSTDVHSAVEELWQLPSEKRADAFMLPPLVDGEARRLFLGKAGLANVPDDVEELANQVVRRCGGMPLALEVVGAFFSDPANWERREEFMEEWGSEDNPLADALESRVLKSLQTSFDFLEGPTQEVFLDIVSFYLGSSWNFVGSIVGEQHMRKLEKACLIKQVPDEPNQTWRRRRNIWAHDLIKMLGSDQENKEKRFRGSRAQVIEIIATTGPALDDIKGVWDEEAAQIRFDDGVQFPQQLGVMKELRVLELHTKSACPPLSMPSLQYLCLWDTSFATGLQLKGCARLTVVKLYRCKIDFQQGVQLPRGLRRLYLHDCDTPACLPPSLGECRKLEVLKITRCSNLQRLPGPKVISQLTNLRKLVVENCPLLLEGPMLPPLGHLEVITLKLGAPGFTSQQVLRLPPNLQLLRLRKLRLRGLLPTATTLSSLHHPHLQHFDLTGCTSPTGLPGGIFGGLSALHILRLTQCTSLTSLPDAIFRGISALQGLDLSGCTSLTGLPDAIFGGLSALQKLDLSGCTSLTSLPDAIFGGLSSLKQLHLCNCFSLTGLPDTIFGGLSALEQLHLSRCTSLTGLPDAIFGGLSALRYVELSGCTSLTRLPNAPPLMCMTRIHYTCGH